MLQSQSWTMIVGYRKKTKVQMSIRTLVSRGEGQGAREKHLLSPLARRPLPVLISLLFLLPGIVHAQMRVTNTPHYTIHSDLDPRLAEDLSLRMESMYAEYTTRLADFSPPDNRKLEVYLYEHRSDYLKLIKDSLPNTGGAFMARQQMLAAFLDEQGRANLRRTLQHEAFHQFAYAAISPKLPVWLNEGIAQVFEEGIWTGRQFMLGQVPPRRIRQLQQDIKDQRIVPFRTFMAKSDTEWAKELRDATTAASRYSQAWAMTHFLIFANDETDQPKYRSRLITLLKLIHNGKPPEDAFTEAFSDNVDGFQQRFMEYARTLQPTREVALLETQEILADMLISLGNQGKRFDNAAAFRRALVDGGYRLHYTRGGTQWSTASDPAIYFRDEVGRPLTSDQLYFSPRGGAPFPDIICKPVNGLQFRTVFHFAPDRPDHETIVEKQ